MKSGGCPLTGIPGSAPITQFREESVVGFLSLRTWRTCDAGSGFGEPTGRSSS